MTTVINVFTNVHYSFPQNTEKCELLEAQLNALRTGTQAERTALERRARELGDALDEMRVKLANSEMRVSRADKFATKMKRERDDSGTRRSIRCHESDDVADVVTASCCGR